MRMIQIILVLLLITSCSLLKRTSKTIEEASVDSNEEIVSSTVLAKNKQTNALQTINIRDSTGSDYLIWLWPKGQINFSAGGDFSGEFDSLRMIGRQKKLSQSKGIIQLSATEKGSKRSDSVRTKKDSMARKMTARIKVPEGRVIVIVFIVACLLFAGFKLWNIKG